MSAVDPSLRHAIADVYRDHHSWLVGWLRRKLGGADHAADLAQDTFVRIIGAKGIDAVTLREPRAYLTTIAQRLLINHVRRQSLERAYLDVLAALPQSQAPSPEARALILEALHQIDAMLDGLAPAVREAFLLSQLEGLTYAEIAARQGVALRTVKRYMATAFERCIQLVGDPP